MTESLAYRLLNRQLTNLVNRTVASRTSWNCVDRAVSALISNNGQVTGDKWEPGQPIPAGSTWSTFSLFQPLRRGQESYNEMVGASLSTKWVKLNYSVLAPTNAPAGETRTASVRVQLVQYNGAGTPIPPNYWTQSALDTLHAASNWPDDMKFQSYTVLHNHYLSVSDLTDGNVGKSIFIKAPRLTQTMFSNRDVPSVGEDVTDGDIFIIVLSDINYERTAGEKPRFTAVSRVKFSCL